MLGARFDLAEALDAIAAAREATSATGAEVADAEGFMGAFDQTSEPAMADDQPPIDASCEDLEREMVEVARSVHRLSRVSFKCPVCDSAMAVREERMLSEFGALDVRLHRLACDNCGMLTGRAFHPAVGYHASALKGSVRDQVSDIFLARSLARAVRGSAWPTMRDMLRHSVRTLRSSWSTWACTASTLNVASARQ